jgi:hypothetical protein
VEYIHTTSQDTFSRESVKVDSTFSKENVKEFVFVNGDTVYIEKTIEKGIDRYKYIHDTVYIYKCDTIQVPVPIERKATLWEQTKENLGNLIRLAGLIVFGGFIVWFIALLRKQK